MIENLKESSPDWDELKPRIMKYGKQSTFFDTQSLIQNKGVSSWTKCCDRGTDIQVWWREKVSQITNQYLFAIFSPENYRAAYKQQA